MGKNNAHIKQTTNWREHVCATVQAKRLPQTFVSEPLARETEQPTRNVEYATPLPASCCRAEEVLALVARPIDARCLLNGDKKNRVRAALARAWAKKEEEPEEEEEEC